MAFASDESESFLGMHRIHAQEGSFEIGSFEQFWRDGDFVALVIDSGMG